MTYLFRILFSCLIGFGVMFVIWANTDTVSDNSQPPPHVSTVTSAEGVPLDMAITSPLEKSPVEDQLLSEEVETKDLTIAEPSPKEKRAETASEKAEAVVLPVSQLETVNISQVETSTDIPPSSEDANLAQISLTYQKGLTEKLLQAGLIIIRIDTSDGSYQILPSQDETSAFTNLKMRSFQADLSSSQIRITDKRFTDEINMSRIMRRLSRQFRDSENLVVRIFATPKLEAHFLDQNRYVTNFLLNQDIGTEANFDGDTGERSALGDVMIIGCFDTSQSYRFRATSVIWKTEIIQISKRCA